LWQICHTWESHVSNDVDGFDGRIGLKSRLSNVILQELPYFAIHQIPISEVLKKRNRGQLDQLLRRDDQLDDHLRRYLIHVEIWPMGLRTPSLVLRILFLAVRRLE
jgi:hypothetical protein